ncbi:MAG: anthranilate synthase component I family protein [Acidobacteriota bacterium]
MKEIVATSMRPPVVLRIPVDLGTPVRAFLALTKPGDDAFLLESVFGGESQARYSFLGFAPIELFEAGDGASLRANGRVTGLGSDVEGALAQWAAGFIRHDAPRQVPFLGGAVGWFDFASYGLFEPALRAGFPGARNPRIVFGLFSAGLVFDHLCQEVYLYRIPLDGEDETECRSHLREMETCIAGAVRTVPADGSWSLLAGPQRDRFSRNLAAVQSAILAGDAYQVVLSEPFEGRYCGDPFAVYRRLRRLNPSPYHFYISLAGRQVLGASPEMLVRIEGREVTTIPIAGTRRRGATPQEDAALEDDLRADPKELAEHAMLVDLARNDLGRVCDFGSVTVPVRGRIERFSHVMHMTSEVRGRLSPDRSPLDAVWSTFPAGTVSGAPKIRAVQMLSELEGADRGLYGGAVGVIDASGTIETCIAIRSMEFEGETVRFRSGAGIVADSNEDSEWAEIHHKAAALLAALHGDDARPAPLTTDNQQLSTAFGGER